MFFGFVTLKNRHIRQTKNVLRFPILQESVNVAQSAVMWSIITNMDKIIDDSFNYTNKSLPTNPNHVSVENLIVLEFLSYDDANKSMDVKFQSATQDVVYKVQVKDKICISLRGESV